MKKRMLIKVVSFACSFAVAFTSVPFGSQYSYAEENDNLVNEAVETSEDKDTSEEIKYIETDGYRIIDDGTVDEKVLEYFNDSSRDYEIDENSNSNDGFCLPVLKNSNGDVYEFKKDDEEIDALGGVYDDIPAKYDLREENRVSDVIEDQKSTSTCWAHAAIESCESNMLTSRLVYYNDQPDINFSEAHLAWFTLEKASNDEKDTLYGDCMNHGAGSSGSYFCYDNGGTIFDAETSLAAGKGLVYESDLSDVTNKPNLTDKESLRYESHGLLVNTNRYNIQSTSNSSYDNEMYNEIKKQIIDNGAVAIYFRMEFAYNNQDDTAQYCPFPLNPNHAVTVIGWDDNFSYNSYHPEAPAPGNGAWLCKNSYGDYNTRDDGCFWLSYYDRTVTYAMSYEVADREEYGNIYQYFGNFGGLRDVSAQSTYALANVYTSDGSGEISAIGFDTFTNNASVEVEIYRDTKSVNEKKDENIIYRRAYYYPIEGYHVVDFIDCLDIPEGESFLVIVKVKGNNAYFLKDSHKYKTGNCFEGIENSKGEISWAEPKDHDCNIKVYTVGKKRACVKADKPSGSYKNSVSITLYSPVENTQILYTTDGSMPDENSKLYSEPITFSYDKDKGVEKHILKAKLIIDGDIDRKTVTYEYTVKGPGLYVSLDAKGGSLSSNSLQQLYVEKGKPISGLSYPIKQGEDFCGWFLNGKPIDNGSVISDDIKDDELIFVAQYDQIRLMVGQKTDITELIAPYVSKNVAEQYRWKVSKKRAKIVKEGDKYYLEAKKAGNDNFYIQKKEGKKWKKVVFICNFKVTKPKFKKIKVSKSVNKFNAKDKNKSTNYPSHYQTTLIWDIKNPKKKTVAEIDSESGEVKILNSGSATILLNLKREGAVTKKPFKIKLIVSKK